MLFLLSKKLIEPKYYNIYSVKIKRAVKNILQGVRESKHLIYAEYDVLEFFLKNLSDNDDKIVLNSVIGQYSLLNYDMIKRRINIVPEPIINLFRLEEEFKIVDLSVDFFQDSRISQPVTFLCENDGDINFFHAITKYYLKNNNLNLNLSYESVHGGGSTMFQSYSKIQQEKNKFCLAFSEMDKHYPEDDEGNTVINLKNVDDLNNHICEIYVVDAQEIENLVPINYIEKLKNINKKHLNKIKKVAESEYADLLKYFDFKRGIQYKKIKTKREFKKYTQTIYVCDSEAMDFNSFCATLNDDDLVIHPLGKIVNQILMDNDLFNQKPQLLSFQKKEWENIGQEFFDWACARNKEALN